MNNLRCYKCDEIKHISSFSKDNNRKRKYQRNCKSCNSKYRKINRNRILLQKREYYRTDEGITKQLFDHARYRSRKKNITFNITYDWVLSQVTQIKECPIRNVKFVTGYKKFADNSRTLDRVNIGEGYTESNTRLISFRANLIKNNSSILELRLLVDFLNKIKKYDTQSWIEKFKILDCVEQEILVPCNIRGNKCYKNISSRMVQDAKRRAKRKFMNFSITKNDIVIPEVCPVLRIPLIKGVGRKTNNSPTIDRIDNNKGYIPENIQIISNKANIMKNNCTYNELKNICKSFEMEYNHKD